MAWSGAGLECLGEVSEDEADAIVGEEQVGGELGARGPLLLLLLILGAGVPLGRCRRGGWMWPGLGVGVGGGEAGAVGGLVGGGRGGCGRAVAGPMARAAALEAASGRRRSHGGGGRGGVDLNLIRGGGKKVWVLAGDRRRAAPKC